MNNASAAHLSTLAQKITSLLDEHLQEIHTVQKTTELLVSQIPFVNKLIEENNLMKLKIESLLEGNNRENISLEISDTKIVSMDPDNTPDLRTQHLLFESYNENEDHDSLSMRVGNDGITASLSYQSDTESNYPGDSEDDHEEEEQDDPEPAQRDEEKEPEEEGEPENGEPDEEEESNHEESNQEEGEPDEEEGEPEEEEDEPDEEEGRTRGRRRRARGRR